MFLDSVRDEEPTKTHVDFYFSYHELADNAYKKRHQVNRMVKEIEEKLKNN